MIECKIFKISGGILQIMLLLYGEICGILIFE